MFSLLVPKGHEFNSRWQIQTPIHFYEGPEKVGSGPPGRYGSYLPFAEMNTSLLMFLLFPGAYENGDHKAAGTNLSIQLGRIKAYKSSNIRVTLGGLAWGFRI